MSLLMEPLKSVFSYLAKKSLTFSIAVRYSEDPQHEICKSLELEVSHSILNLGNLEPLLVSRHPICKVEFSRV